MRVSCSIGISVLGCALAAQSVTVSSPYRFGTIEGESWADEFGHQPSYRHMLFDGELGGRVMTIKSVRLREDYRDQYASIGRSWNRITLDLSTCDFSKRNRVFSQNPTSTPTRVFSSGVVWPTIQGRPATVPTAWTGRNGALRFPFSRGWSYTGTTDVCLDFQFAGGVLATRGSWSGGQGRYQLDSFGTGWRNGAWMLTYGRGCRDSSWSLGGVIVVDSATHGSLDPNPSFRNRHVFQTQSFATARGKPVVHAIGIGGHPVGVTCPGVTCEKLFDDLSLPIVFLSFVADGQTSMARSPFVTAPYSPAVVGAEVWGQAAWADSANGALRLSKAARTTIVDLPRVYRRSALVGLPTGTVGPTGDSAFNPILNWR